jgi:hypothetical protein
MTVDSFLNGDFMDDSDEEGPEDDEVCQFLLPVFSLF